MTATRGARRTNLPAELSSFVGRRHELAQVRSALETNRLVTLFGPGGVGKTRLAFRAAADLARGYEDGSWVVELAPVPDPALVAESVVAALGLRDVRSGSAVDRLVAHLRDRELLLVLDNCEHVQEAASSLAGQLLEACSRLHVIATSRHALGVEGEYLLSVPPLGVPAVDRETGSPEGLLHYDAVRLFVDRATSSWASFEVNAANQNALAELVRRLDGVPLAIELASVRVRSLSVQQILDRLADRFALLTRGDRSALPRQQTLRALIDWSHDLLGGSERLVWARATVFSGSFDLDAVRVVLCDDQVPEAGIAEVVEGLVSKSILVQEGAGEAARFHMLESIKEYGGVQLAAAEETTRFVRRHRDYYADLAARAAAEMFSAAGVGWFQRLRLDHDNLRLALEHCIGAAGRPATGDVTRGLRMMGSLQHYWVMVGRFSEARLWLDRLLALTPPPGAELAAGLEVAGRLAVLQGDVDRGRPLLERALGEATDAGSDTWRAHALHGMALAAVFWAEPAEAVTLLEEALSLHRDGEDPLGVPLALVQLATVHATLDEPELAMQYAEQCIAMSEASAEQWCAGLARWVEALVAWRQRRPARVRSYARDVLSLKAPFGDRMGMAMSLEVIAWADAADGRHEQAATLLGAAEAALSSIGGSLFGHLLDDHADCVDRTRAALGATAYDAACARGAALAFEEAVALAVGRRRQAPGRDRAGRGRGSAAGAETEARLTKRERQIAGLVAEGLTNREVAERLVMSQRTAEGHVARAMAKLGLTSRTQLAAWVAEHGTGDMA